MARGSRCPDTHRRYSTLLKPSDRPVEPQFEPDRIAAEPPPPTHDLMAKRSRQPKKNRLSKLFVLDTNVLMHDPTSLFRFEEHDIYLPNGTLEELDDNKKG